MDASTASKKTLTVTDSALALAMGAGFSSDDLFRAAEQAILNNWVSACDTWAEAAFTMWATNPGARFAGRFLNFMVRMGGPEATELDTLGPITIMTLDEARE